MMAEYSSTTLVDILPLEPALQLQHDMIFIPAGILALLFILYFFYRYQNNPLRLLHRQLIKQHFTPREVAQKLLHFSQLKPSIKSQLEEFCFSRNQPSQQQILELLRKIR